MARARNIKVLLRLIAHWVSSTFPESLADVVQQRAFIDALMNWVGGGNETFSMQVVSYFSLLAPKVKIIVQYKTVRTLQNGAEIDEGRTQIILRNYS